MNKENVKKAIGEKLFNLFEKYDVILAGGSIRAMYCHTLENAIDFYEEDVINDLDIYFKNKDCIKNVEKELKELGYSLEFETVNALTYRKEEYCPIQLIILESCIMKSPNELIKTFDFSVCAGAYDFKFDKFYLNTYFEEDNQKRKLRFNPKTLFPITSLIRVNKYTRGKKYIIQNIEYLKIALCINKLRIDTFGDLKEQLNGIDTAILKPLTDNFIYDKEYDINEFLDEMDNFLEKLNSLDPLEEDTIF